MTKKPLGTPWGRGREPNVTGAPCTTEIAGLTLAQLPMWCPMGHSLSLNNLLTSNEFNLVPSWRLFRQLLDIRDLILFSTTHFGQTAYSKEEKPDLLGVDHYQQCRIKLQIKFKAERTAMEGFYC